MNIRLRTNDNGVAAVRRFAGELAEETPYQVSVREDRADDGAGLRWVGAERTVEVVVERVEAGETWGGEDSVDVEPSAIRHYMRCFRALARNPGGVK